MTWIKRVMIKNYRSIVDLQVELAQINFIFGKNATGKSNFLRAIFTELKPNISFSDIDKCMISKGKPSVHIEIDNPEEFDVDNVILISSSRSFIRENNVYTRNTYAYLNNLLHDKEYLDDENAAKEIEFFKKWFFELFNANIKAYEDLSISQGQRPRYLIYVVEKWGNKRLEFRLNQSGYGRNTFYPIFFESIVPPEGKIILIEEPEISLHPAMISKTLDFFIEMARKRKHQYIIASHSLYYLDRIGKFASENKLSDITYKVFISKKTEKGTIFEEKTIRSREDVKKIINELTQRD